MMDHHRALEEVGYTLGSKIGKGSYATVMNAKYKDSRGRVLPLACKIVDKKKAPKEFMSRFFHREISILTKIDHACIIKTHSILKRGVNIFIFMRIAEKGDLLNYIKDNGNLQESLAKEWFYQMLKGMQYLHSINVAHRDLKCENILITKHMNIKIADFGFAGFCCNSEGETLYSQTYCGSAAYAAPEVVSGIPYDPMKADVWSLGVILFIMMNGSMPFEDSNLSQLVRFQLAQKYLYNEAVQQSISQDCKNLIYALLHPNIDMRWAIRKCLTAKWFIHDPFFMQKYYQNPANEPDENQPPKPAQRNKYTTKRIPNNRPN